MHDLVIVGAGGHGRETLDIVEAINAASAQPLWRFVGFVDDGPADNQLIERRNTAVVGATEWLEANASTYVIGIGSPEIRAQLDARLTAAGRTAATLVHPSATVGSDNSTGHGVLLAAGSRVTTNVTLGRHVHLNVNAVVSHDCIIGDHTTLSPGVHLNGNVTVGNGVFFGTGAIVTPGITIGDHAVVGAGAVVVADVPAGSTVKGVPAK